MEQNSNNIVDIHYQQTGEATATDALGMREMQAKAYEARNRRFLLILFLTSMTLHSSSFCVTR